MPPSPLQKELDQVLHDFFAGLRRLAIAALVKTEITDEEKFALCWASGVPIKFEDGKFKTESKCNVVRIEDHWQIFMAAPPGNFHGSICESATKPDEIL